MKFLIIDDDEVKVEHFTKCLNSEDSFELRMSYNSGLRELIKNRENYDCLILDMNFPRFDKERSESDMGLNVLRQIERKQINIPTVIYSSKYVDVSKYGNIIEYIPFDARYSMEKDIISLKNKL